MSNQEIFLGRWQWRTREPSDYENVLGDALEAAFADGIIALPDLVRRLNEVSVKAPDGRDWTEESFQVEMRWLGA